MAGNNLLHTEQVREGEKAHWPFDSSYNEPSRTGYLFEGWKYKNRTYTPQEYSSEANNPFGPITENNTDIFGVWDKLTIHADSNHLTISGDGDTDADPTKLSYWISSDGGKMITQDVTLEEVAIDSGISKINFTDVGTSVVGNKNVATKKATANDSEDSKYYRFRAKTTKYGGMQSDVIEIEQIGGGQILLLDFDYFTFKYTWDASDGTDLDTATYIYDSGITLETNGQPLEYYPVGWNTGGSQHIDPDYSGPSTPTPLFVEVSKYIKGAGDNLQSGNESALINLREVCNNISPTVTKIRCELYGNWYKERGDGNCSLTFQTWKTDSGEGGMQLDRNSAGKTLFTFSPTGDTYQKTIQTISGNVYASSKENGVDSSPSFEYDYYSHIATLVYNVKTRSAILTNRMKKKSGRNVCFDVTINNERRNTNAVTNYITGYVDECEKGYDFGFDYTTSRLAITINSAKLYINGVATNVYVTLSESQIEAAMNTGYVAFDSASYDSNNNLKTIYFKFIAEPRDNDIVASSFRLQFTNIEEERITPYVDIVIRRN